MFPIPSLLDCVQFTRQAFRSYLPGTDAWLWPNNIGPTAKVVGGSAREIFKRLDYVGQQAFALTAVGKYLGYKGSEVGVYQKSANPASGNMVITTLDAIAVANGAQFERADGVLFAATAAVSLGSAGTVSVAVISNVAAAAANSQPGAPMTILSGVTGPGAPGATAAVDSNGIAGGLDVEADGPLFTSDLSTYRGRILFRKRNPIMGGAPADYVGWATAVPGVTRVFVERRWAGNGTVRVFPLFDVLFAASGGIADAGHIALVNDALQAEAPAGCALTVVAPTAQPINIAIANLLPNTAAAQAAVLAELADAFQRLGRVAGADPANAAQLAAMPFLATAFTMPRLWISQAVANATGVMSADVNGPAIDEPVAVGAIPTLGAVTFS